MTASNNFREKAQEFLAIAPQFRLGELVTEQPHPLTGNLAELAKQDPAKALGILHKVDCDALGVLAANCIDRITLMAQRIRQTLDKGKSVYLCGCGATGRLSLACEAIWHRTHRGESIDKRVIGFMAGGDAALVRSIEDFEDHPEYGERQMRELGFKSGDLFIGCTEGGETPFVIGATLFAAETSANPPFFLYCNPDDILCRVAQRSLQVIEDGRIEKINCTVGPMAVTGSTRMQASTALMAAVGYALAFQAAPERIPPALSAMIACWQEIDPGFLANCVIKETDCYLHGGYLEYLTDRDLAITILTDTTERSPTFSVHPFENSLDAGAPNSLCYLFLAEAADSAEAWNMVLGRKPRPLEWEHLRRRGIASKQRLLGFDFSARGRAGRLQKTAPATECSFTIKNEPRGITFDFQGVSHCLDAPETDMLCRHLVLKMLLNMHSTLVMGRLGRFEGNVMTWVRPSNNKLVDRAIRYADFLLKKKGIAKTYEHLAYACFELQESAAADQSLVHALVQRFSGPSQS